MSVLELYPQCGREQPVNGLYLAHRIYSLGTEKQAFIYANFLQSLDGRIAVNDGLPEGLGSSADFRLFLELQAQADCLITHGGYLRAIRDGRLDDILRIKETDLVEWRRQQGLAPQPAVVVASASLDFELPPSLTRDERQVLIATGEDGDAKRVREWQDRGYEVISAGREKYVEGAPLVAALSKLGFRTCYLLAGP
ncbi:MAG: RibD family protein, partial [Burkholderiales bacterium]